MNDLFPSKRYYIYEKINSMPQWVRNKRCTLSSLHFKYLLYHLPLIPALTYVHEYKETILASSHMLPFILQRFFVNEYWISSYAAMWLILWGSTIYPHLFCTPVWILVRQTSKHHIAFQTPLNLILKLADAFSKKKSGNLRMATKAHAQRLLHFVDRAANSKSAVQQLICVE